MSLKNKISLVISLLLTFIFAIAVVVIYLLFYDFRKDEFEKRLQEHAIATIELLTEVEKIDQHVIRIIDKNSIDKLYNEKTLIFDNKFSLIYSSLDNTKVHWSKKDLEFLKTHNSFFRIVADYEICGFKFKAKDKNFYAIVSAKDTFGKRKLEYLLVVLIVTYLIFIFITWLFTYKAVKHLLAPIQVFLTQLKGINEQNLDTRIPLKAHKDEIDYLASEFNQMLARIDMSYTKQQEFTANASHELRTPIARLIAQLENKIVAQKGTVALDSFYVNLLKDVNQLNDLTNSLLILSKLDKQNGVYKEICRLDELIFEAVDLLSKEFSNFKLDLDFDLAIATLEIKGNKALLLIAFQNLLKNAYLYSDNKLVKVDIASNSNQLITRIINTGKTISTEEQQRLYEPFMRGANSKSQTGLGLGLRIVQRIILQHKGTIVYKIGGENENIFEIRFENPFA